MRIWQGYNARLQTYLQAIYETDQENEREEKQRFNLGQRSRPVDE